MIRVLLSLHIVIAVMYFSDDLGEKLSIMYNYTAIQIEPEEPKAICCDSNNLWCEHWLKGYLPVTKTQYRSTSTLQVRHKLNGNLQNEPSLFKYHQ